MKKHNAVSTHDLKLEIIKNPHVKPIALALMIGVDASEIYKARNELNIPCKGKYEGCKG